MLAWMTEWTATQLHPSAELIEICTWNDCQNEEQNWFRGLRRPWKYVAESIPRTFPECNFYYYLVGDKRKPDGNNYNKFPVGTSFEFMLRVYEVLSEKTSAYGVQRVTFVFLFHEIWCWDQHLSNILKRKDIESLYEKLRRINRRESITIDEDDITVSEIHELPGLTDTAPNLLRDQENMNHYGCDSAA